MEAGGAVAITVKLVYRLRASDCRRVVVLILLLLLLLMVVTVTVTAGEGRRVGLPVKQERSVVCLPVEREQQPTRADVLAK
jgi:hypothetical protein